MENSKKIRILLTGGGTAGHVWPTISVAKEIRKINKNSIFLYVGSFHGLESSLVPEEGFEYKAVPTGKLRRYFSWENFIDPIRAFAGFFKSLRIIKNFKPHVIFAKGGYVTVPVVLAGFILKVPIILHESDSVMGMANKFLSKYASKIAVSFPKEYYPEPMKNKIVYTGLPVRDIFYQTCKKMSHQLKTILVMGGSQGSKAINQMIFNILNRLTVRYKVIHLTGQSDFEQSELVKSKLEKPENYQNYSFVNQEIVELINSADLVVTRAGANSLFELAYLKKPLIVIPLPTSASNHQNANARIFKEKEAALVLRESKIDSDELLEKIRKLISSEDILNQYSKKVYQFYKKKAGEQIAALVLEYASDK